MKLRFISLVTVLLVTLACFTPVLATGSVARIGIVTDGAWMRFPETIDLFKQEIVEMTAGEFDVQFPEDSVLDGNWSVSGINQAIDSLLLNPKVDIVITLGPVASNEVCKRRDLKKPVIAPFVIDEVMQGLPEEDGASGVKNLSYINSFRSIDRNINAFREIVPFSQLALVVDSFTRGCGDICGNGPGGAPSGHPGRDGHTSFAHYAARFPSAHWWVGRTPPAQLLMVGVAR
ncbi:MAG: hypothetical protein JRI70_07070, partial [Deltaproteobacteria bacterium]|nr:hypothetical protein [Deltaproteobacteria bacterium]